MNIFEIIAVLIVLLIAIPIVLKKRKKCASCHSSNETPKSESKIPEQVKQPPETKSADKPVANTQATVVNSPEPKPVVNIESSAKPQVKETEVPFPGNAGNSFLPQDSILKRHFLSHVYTMIDSLAPPRPTESVLRRHYDAIIITKVVQCLYDKKAMEQLIEDYKNRK